MRKLTPANIEEISKCGDLIKILPVHGNPIAIDKSLFQHWVDAHWRREWGTNEGDTGTHSWEEYYSSEYYEPDLIEYYNEVREVALRMRPFDQAIAMIR